jgi:hypothetical protein
MGSKMLLKTSETCLTGLDPLRTVDNIPAATIALTKEVKSRVITQVFFECGGRGVGENGCRKKRGPRDSARIIIWRSVDHSGNCSARRLDAILLGTGLLRAGLKEFNIIFTLLYTIVTPLLDLP